ncbi:MAG: sodium:proton antiporter [Fidelibacterota bacterium]
MYRKSLFKIVPIVLFLFNPVLLLAEEAGHHAPHVDGSSLAVYWVIPFFGILLSIAVMPLVAPRFWHHNFGKISFMWAAIFMIPFYFSEGFDVTLFELLHVGLLDYIPFIILLFALFTISGGIRITGTLVGRPGFNTGLILLGTILASWMGTTGAAMLLIRPLLRANAWRKHKIHIVVFFIFLVANIGGSLTPLGDPPLFLGFLKGVDFFWTTKSMFIPMVSVVVFLLTLFYFMDSFYYKKEGTAPNPSVSERKIGVEGAVNFLLLGGVIGSVLLSGIWDPKVTFHVFYVEVLLQNLTRDILLLILAFMSMRLTAGQIREKNEFTWFPIVEVAKLFAGIFVTIIPAIAILRAGTHGAMAPIISTLYSDGEPLNIWFFWRTGLLSSFLDNAPTYLVFFNAAGGNAMDLMTTHYNTLLAISAGAVFMGANTYIGNAPNFMVKSIAEESGVQMPSFFGYMLKYSLPILIPTFLLVGFIFFT